MGWAWKMGCRSRRRARPASPSFPCPAPGCRQSNSPLQPALPGLSQTPRPPPGLHPPQTPRYPPGLHPPHIPPGPYPPLLPPETRLPPAHQAQDTHPPGTSHKMLPGPPPPPAPSKRGQTRRPAPREPSPAFPPPSAGQSYS